MEANGLYILLVVVLFIAQVSKGHTLVTNHKINTTKHNNSIN